MKMMTHAQVNEIRRWIYRHARPLELAHWQYCFEHKDAAAVMEALRCYQNADGGFGHALEPDCWNPASSAYDTCIALDLLETLPDSRNRELIYQKLFHFLSKESTAWKQGWPFVIPTNTDYPHAPWMGYSEQLNENESFGLTLDLARHILLHHEPEDALKTKAQTILKQALTCLFKQNSFGEMGVSALCALLVHLDALPVDQADHQRIRSRVTELIVRQVEKDPEQWQYYKPRPSYFIRSQESAGYLELKELVEKELDYLIDTCPENDVWDIPWTWAGLYPEEYRVARIWWKAWKAIENLTYLETFGRIAKE